MQFVQAYRSSVVAALSGLSAGLRFLLAQAVCVALLICIVSPASGQVLFPRDYGNGQVLSFSGGTPGGDYELRILKPDGSGLAAPAEAFLNASFIDHRQVKLTAQNVAPETYRSFYTLIRGGGSSQLLAGVYNAGTDEVVAGPLEIVTVYDPSPQFRNAEFTGNQRWTTAVEVLEATTRTFSFSWTAVHAGTKNWYLGNRASNPPIRCQISTGNAAVLPNARTDSHLATLVMDATGTAGTSGKVSIEFAAPSYDPGGRNDYTVRIHNWQDPNRIGGEGSPSGCNGSALDVRITVKPVNTAPRFVDGTPQDRDLPSLLNSHGVVLDVGGPVAATDREDGHLTYSIENVYKSNGPHTTPPYQSNCTETTCTDGVFDIDPSSGQIRTKANKSYTRQPYFVVVTVTDNEGLSDRTYVWINDGPVPYQPWDLMVFPGETTVLLSWLRPERRPYAGPLIGYRIEWSATGNSDWQVLVENTGNLFTEYCDRGLTSGTRRYYRVRAVNAVGYGNPSNVDGATVGAGGRAQQLSAFALSVADAQVTEAAGAAVNFTVSLEPASASTITVDYATADGTAAAGLDYTQTAGTLTFKAGETSKTVAVAVLDDAIDEGEETFTLILRNPTGEGVYLQDAEATGTIQNSDPMPRAWLARFGRTAANHVFDAVEQRLQGELGEPYVQLAGYRIGGPRLGEPAPGLPLQPRPTDSLTAADPAGRDLALNQFLQGSAFHLVSDEGKSPFGPRLSAWGRVASSALEGTQDDVRLDGTVTTATLGVDGAWRRWLMGIALAYSDGDGSYTMGELGSGGISSTLTSIHPYVSYALSDRVRVWGMAGYGSGTLILAGDETIRTDLDTAMGALGVRGRLLDASRSTGGLTLAVRSDALWTRTSSSLVDGQMLAADAATSRLRLVLEVSRPVALSAGGTLTPIVEIGLRHDGGDAERGSGLEVGGRLGYSTAWGLTAEISIHALLVHEASDYQEWGASGTIRFDSGRKGLGLIASLEPTWGAAASGTERLWNQPDARSLAEGGAWPQAVGSVEAELGYGLAALAGHAVCTPYARASVVDDGEQAWHVGARVLLREFLNVSLEASRRQRQDEPAAHELALLAAVPW